MLAYLTIVSNFQNFRQQCPNSGLYILNTVIYSFNSFTFRMAGKRKVELD